MRGVNFYNDKKRQTHKQRKESSLYDVRTFNNFIKAVSISKNTKHCENVTVLDYCGGQGGDFPKFSRNTNIKKVVLIDASSASVSSK